jgi:hypothetical protein
MMSEMQTLKALKLNGKTTVQVEMRMIGSDNKCLWIDEASRCDWMVFRICGYLKGSRENCAVKVTIEIQGQHET